MDTKATPDIFISYSRKDIAFAKLIRESLIENGFEVWIDWERIPTGVYWWETIQSAIQSSNTFLFIISQASIGSSYCRDEINVAMQNHKRIIPVIVDDLSPDRVGEFVPELRKINWIIFRRDQIFRVEVNPEVVSEKPEDRELALPGMPQYALALEKLSHEIQTDWDWVTYHTRLQSEALRWSENKQNTSFLLRGLALEEAEGKLLAAGEKEPAPTLLQSQYVTASRQEETRAQAAERAMEQKAARRQRLLLWAIGVGLLIASVLMLLFLNQRNQYLAETFVRATAEANAVDESHARATQEAVAIEQRNVALNRQLAAQARTLAGRTLDLGLLLAVEAGKASSLPDVQNTLLEVLQLSPALAQFIPGHPHGFSQIAVSADGKLLAAGAVDGTLQLFDLASGKPLGSPLNGPPSEITAVAFSPDGRTLAAVCNDPLLFFWDISDPARIRSLSFQEMKMDSAQETLLINSDGKIFSTYSGRFFLGLSALWNHYGDTPEEDTRLNTFGAFSLRYSPDGSLLAVGAGDGSIRLWDVKAGKWQDGLPMLRPAVTGQVRPITTVFSLGFSQDGRSLVASAGAIVRVWNVRERSLVAERNCMTGSAGLYLPTAIDPSGKRAVYVCNTNNADGSISPALRIMNLEQPKADDIEQVLPAQLLSIEFRPAAGELLALGTTENSVILWNLATGQAVGEPLRAHNAEVASLAFLPDGSRLVSADWNHNLAVWNLGVSNSDGRLATRLTLPPESENSALAWSQMGSLAFNGDGSQLFASRYVGHKVYQADLAGGQAARQLAGSSAQNYILMLEYLPEINALLWIQSSGEVLLTDPATGQALRTIATRSSATPSPSEPFTTAPESTAYAVDRESLRLVNASKGALRLWDLKTGQVLPQKLELADLNFSFPVFSPDGSWLALRGRPVKTGDEVLVLWQIASGKTIRLALTTGASNGGLNVAFTPDNRKLAYSRLDKNYYLCDLSLEKPACQVGGANTNWITSLAFNHTGSQLATLSTDGALRLWDANGKPAGSLPAPSGYFLFRWSPDDRKIALAGNSSTLVVLDAGPQPWSQSACRMAGRNLSLLEWQTYLPGRPYHKTCPALPLHPSVVEDFLVAKAAPLATGSMETALAGFAKELPLDSTLLPELKAAAAAFSPQALGLRAAYLVDSDPAAALTGAAVIERIFGPQALDPNLWNHLCWNGSLYGQPGAALPFCEAALKLDPGNPSYLDSRGLARALTGNLAGAAADFKVFVEASLKDGRYPTYGKQRESWIAALEKGQSPFDASLIEALKKE